LEADLDTRIANIFNEDKLETALEKIMFSSVTNHNSADIFCKNYALKQASFSLNHPQVIL